MANETPSRPPPLMANAIKNFHFDFPHTSLIVIFGEKVDALRRHSNFKFDHIASALVL